MDVRKLGVEVTPKGINTTADQLGRLVKAAAQIDPVINQAKKSLASFGSFSLDATSKEFSDTSKAAVVLSDSVKKITTSASGFKNATNAFTSLATASEKLAAQTAGLEAYQIQLTKIKDSLLAMKGAGLALPKSTTSGSRSSVTPEDTKATDNLTAAQKRLMAQLEREALMVGKTRSEYLAARAAKLGLADAANPYIATLKNAEKGTKNFTMSLRAQSAAMRMVPAQFTDIFTQLAGGQNPLLIMLQQGGQLRDMFGGFGAMARNVGPMVLKFLVNPFTLAAAAIGTLTYGLISGSNEAEKFGKSLALTGNFIGITTNQFSSLRESVGKLVGDEAKAAQAITAIANTSALAGSNIDKMAVSIVKFSKASGIEIQKVADMFADLAESPSEAIVKLNKQYHFLTAATYAQIRALEEQGKKQEAAAVAQAAFGNAAENMALRVETNLGLLSRSWLAITKQITNAKNALFDFGRTDISAQISSTEKMLALRKQMAAAETRALGAPLPETAKELDNLQQKLNTLRASTEVDEQAAAIAKNRQAIEEKGVAAVSKVLALSKQGLSVDQQRAKAHAELTKNIQDAAAANQAFTADQIKAARNAIDKQFSNATQQATTTRLSSLKAELQGLTENLNILKKYPESYHAISEAEKELYATQLKIASGAFAGEKLSALKQEEAVLKQQVAVQKELNAVKESYDGVKQWREQQKWVDNTNASLREQLEYLSLTGATSDTRTEIERKLTAAMAEASNQRISIAEQEAAGVVAAGLRIAKSNEDAVKSKLAANAILAETRKLDAQHNADLVITAARQEHETAILHLSNRAKERANALFQIESDLKKELAVLSEKLTSARMRESDAEVAAIEAAMEAEKRRAAEKAKAVPSGKRQPLEGASFSADAMAAMDNFYDSLQTRQQILADTFSQTFGKMSDAMSDFVMTGKLDFRALAQDIFKMIAQMLVKMLALKAVQATIGLFGQGAAFGAGGGSPQAFAQGGTFTNSIVRSPTPFKFANGAGFSDGVMGEAGAEAVMPLTRTSNGDLGVKMTGGGSSGGMFNITVNILDGTATTTESSENTSTQQQTIGRELTNKMKQVIQEELRPGGILAR